MIEFDPATHTYTLDGQPVPSVTKILSDMNFIDTAYFTEYSRTRGTLVHRIIHWHVEGTLDPSTVDPSLMGYFTAWRRFVDDTGFVSTETEKPLASEIYRFAGTPDHIGMLNGREAVIDVKSGAVFPSTPLQLGGYEILAGRRLARFALCLKDDGKYNLKPEYKDRQDRNIFLSAVSCWHWQNTCMKGRAA